MVATAAAVTLSWFGVHSVLRSTAYDLPPVLPVTAESVGSATSYPDVAQSPPVASSTHRPRPTTPPPSTATTPAKPTPTPTTAVPPKTPPGTPRATSSSPSTSTGNVHSYPVKGGRVVLDLAPSGATLVSASPTADWKMQVWNETGWLRVTFTSADGDEASSVFCTWNGHPPSVQTYED
ncbi:hypothetical protein [Streptomyces sp. NBC_01190]|uniref:hypothetical protein n=1 Tax=Streptomyces sp. NBC_01190 TaxID=2903767 RepID=UPI0038700463|nr:hypothetical protein OG519_10930 [Streptomyces sp. NBC_01190]